MKTRQGGFTLVEMLVSIAVMGILMLAFTQLFGGSLRASSQINGRNELISEGQIAQQLIASRLQNAYYVYPQGTALQLTTAGVTTRNTVRSGAGQNWVVGNDPIVAVLVPPRSFNPLETNPLNTTCRADNLAYCYTFYAYYPMLRSALVTAAPDSAPPADANNANVWVLMEYRANIIDNINRNGSDTGCPAAVGVESGRLYCPPLPGTASGIAYRGQPGRMLIDYVQPTTNAPAYRMFRVCDPGTSIVQPNCPLGTVATNPISVDFDLRLLQNRGGRALQIPAGNAPLSTRVYPRN